LVFKQVFVFGRKKMAIDDMFKGIKRDLGRRFGGDREDERRYSYRDEDRRYRDDDEDDEDRRYSYRDEHRRYRDYDEDDEERRYSYRDDDDD
jgi:hypothetical protein